MIIENKVSLGVGVIKFIIAIVIMFIYIPKPTLAQQNRVDSILIMLGEVMPQDKLDSIKFREASDILYKTELDDELITSIEKQATVLDRGADQDRSFFLKYTIFNNLRSSDYEKAIKYGQILLQDVEAGKSPNAKSIRDAILSVLRIPYRNSNRLEEGIQYFITRLSDFREMNDSSGMATVHYVLAGFYNTTGLNDEAIYHLKKVNTYTTKNPAHDRTFFNIRQRNTLYFEIQNTSVIGQYYLDKGDLEQALHYSSTALEGAKMTGTDNDISYLTSNIIRVKLQKNDLKDIPALFEMGKDASIIELDIQLKVVMMLLEAEYYIKTKSFAQAESLIIESKRLINENNLPVNSSSGILNPDYYLALLRIEQNRPQEAIELLDADIIRIANLREAKLKDYLLQASLYEELGDYKNAFLINKKYFNLQEEIQTDIDKFRRVSFEVEQEMSQKELSIASLQSENRISSITQKFTIGLAIMFILLAATIYYRFQGKKKANAILESTLANLKFTQSQLIQSEKMASLGELTAGIAHEIQNPLNFVNNFSEVSAELMEELKGERLKVKGERDETVEEEIIGDVIQNLEKITLHGKRADAIVKGMLEHSKRGSGQRQETDINALADEFLRLSYQSFLAKDKDLPIGQAGFKVELQTSLDPDLPKISVIPQDIGKVLLNLYSNAFYAVNERGKKGQAGFEPTVSVSTKLVNSPLGVGGSAEKWVRIAVADNGSGIPQNIVDKIFQPFFTTKPTGSGTGLGLSLSYDIVKAHGGVPIAIGIKVVTEEGKGSEFIIQIPINTNNG